jgi:hypothetical protein
MAIPVAHKRKRGNPNWGRPIAPLLALPTEFELRARHLHLTAELYVSSAALHTWCEQNRNRLYVPEWLLEEWGITVDPGISADFAWSLMRGKRAERAA